MGLCTFASIQQFPPRPLSSAPPRPKLRVLVHINPELPLPIFALQGSLPNSRTNVSITSLPTRPLIYGPDLSGNRVRVFHCVLNGKQAGFQLLSMPPTVLYL